MSIGAGIFLFVVGAILAFAINVDVEWANLDMIGYILMGAGFIIFVIGLGVLMRRRRTEVVTRSETDAAGGSVSRRTVSDSGDDPVH